MKSKKFIIIIFIIIFIIWILPSIAIKIIDGFYKKDGIYYSQVQEEKNVYNVFELYNKLSTINNIKITMETSNNIVYNNNCNLEIQIENLTNVEQYSASIQVNEKVVKEQNLNSNITNINIAFDSEGKKNIKVIIKRGQNTELESNQTIYFIKPYTKQFLDEYSIFGTQINYINGSNENYKKSLDLIDACGFKNVRGSLLLGNIWEQSGNYNYYYYDEWIPAVRERNINIIAIITNVEKVAGNDYKINREEENEAVKEYILKLKEKFGKDIKYFEILNEPNYDLYFGVEDARNYSNLVNCISKDVKNIIVGATSGVEQTYENHMGSIEFFQTVAPETYKNTNIYSYHPYDIENYNNQYLALNRLNRSHKEYFNEIGGFIKKFITEYGVSSNTTVKPEGIDENTQAIKLIEQSVIMNEYDLDLAIQYVFRNTGTDSSSQGDNYGLLTYDYMPKLSYYAMKNFFTNTNGAEYIGTVNLADGLEAHVYDKDGKPKIIAWSDNADNTITIPYKNFTASDIYGNEIENTDGTLEITTSPVYLDNISDEYFYEAISNTTLEKYEEFEEKFEAEIANINGLQEEINKLKEYMVSIASNSTEDENVAIEQMNTHFNLGNVILSAYKNGSLDVEYVKLSSMLDMLNDIGSSYEDLLTVCATTRAPYYTTTEELINSAESKINNNSDLEIVYPSKILDFAKELDEKSEYINSLSEENDIKTGLIVSNSLHAYYLADWANEFASIYIDEYIEVNPVTVSYSNTDEWTNQDVTATLNIGNDDATVTNNGGSNTYIFKANGSFTFEYERRGQAFTLEAKVSNIDKTYPTIAGVKDGQTYTSGVKPVIEDTNLSIVSISYNGENIEYYEGITLEDEGMYSIVATDRAGNTTTVEFNIISDVQDEYVLQGNYLLNVWQETTLADFKNNYTSQEESYIIKRNDTELTDTDIIATGDIIELSSGDTYTIVVAGDINCDGRVTVFDLSALRRYILKQIEFTEIELLSADINIDGNNIGAKDYSRMRLEILGMH